MKNDTNKNIILILSLLFIVFIAIFNENSKTFSTNKWISKNYFNFRFRMIDDLKNKHDIIGMSEKEVKYILGKPNKFDKKRYTYTIKNCKFFKNKKEFIVHFKGNKVIRAIVKQK